MKQFLWKGKDQESKGVNSVPPQRGEDLVLPSLDYVLYFEMTKLMKHLDKTVLTIQSYGCITSQAMT